VYNDCFVLGILNSQLMDTYFKARCLTNKDSIAQVKKTDLDLLPIASLDLAQPTAKNRHDTLVTHVERMLKLHEDVAAAKSPDAQSRLQREIAATDRAIDQLVYQLYNLTPEEIALVEAATAPAAPKSIGEDSAATPEPTVVGYTQAEVDAAHHYSIQEEPPK
jgi:hypothetical protein